MFNLNIYYRKLFKSKFIKVLKVYSYHSFLPRNCFTKLINDVFIVFGISKNTSYFLNSDSTFLFNVVIFILLFILFSFISIFLSLFFILFIPILFYFNLICILFMVMFDFHPTLSTFIIQVINCHKHLCHIQVTLFILIS